MANHRDQRFGVDLKVGDRTGGVDLIPNGRQDLSLVEGNDTIIQALILRLRVRQGELARLGFPHYGSRLHELIGEPNHARTHLKLMAYARAALEADPRVNEIQSIQTEVLPGDRDTVRLLIDILVVDQVEPVALAFHFNLQSVS